MKYARDQNFSRACRILPTVNPKLCRNCPTSIDEVRNRKSDMPFDPLCFRIWRWYTQLSETNSSSYLMHQERSNAITRARGDDRLVAYASQEMNVAQRNYSTTERELLSRSVGYSKLCCFLLGTTVYTNRKPRGPLMEAVAE